MMEMEWVSEPFKTLAPAEQVIVTDEEIEAETLTLADIEEIRENATKEGFQLGKEEGFNQGYSEGKQQGYEEAFKAGEAEVQRQLAVLTQMTEALANPIVNQEQELESLLIDLVQRFAKAVINTELLMDSKPLVTAVKAALSELPAAVSSCEVHVHPDDLSVVESLPSHKGVEWIADATIEQGGCQITSGSTQVDNTVSTRFDQVVAQLSAALGKQTSSESS